MLKTSMLIQEESRIFDELLSRFEALSEEQMQVVGVTREWSSKGLLGHLEHWEQGAAEQVRELRAGTWSSRKRTLEEAEQINQEVTAANHATLVPQLRDQFSRARTEIVSARSFGRSVCDTEVTIWRNCAPGSSICKIGHRAE